MKVLVLEMGGSHIECVYSMVHFLYLKNCPVHVACNKRLLPYLTEPEKLAGLMELPDEFSKTAQITSFLQIRKYIQRHGIDTVIINTTEITIIRNLSFFLPKRINGIGIVHNARKLEKSFTFTKILSKKLKKFFVLGDYLLSQIKPDLVFKVTSFYPVYFPPVRQLTIVKPAGEYWIVIPGEADETRRDYVMLLDAIKNNVSLPAQIKFIFLGKYKLQAVIDNTAKQEDWWTTHITSFDDYLEYDQFHSYIQQADFILPLMKIEHNDFYGNNRISGSFNLGIGYHIPFLLPETYQQNKDLQPFSFYYSNMKELIGLVQRMAENNTEREQLVAAYKKSIFNNIDQLSDNVYDFIVSS